MVERMPRKLAQPCRWDCADIVKIRERIIVIRAWRRQIAATMRAVRKVGAVGSASGSDVVELRGK
jgi:hypothetical protein